MEVITNLQTIEIDGTGRYLKFQINSYGRFSAALSLLQVVGEQEGCTESPSNAPTHMPTLAPTGHPTLNFASPTMKPTLLPSQSPTRLPTLSPSQSPTRNPSASPTRSPTRSPSNSPRGHPALSPTITLTSQSPSVAPRYSANSPSQSPTSTECKDTPNWTDADKHACNVYEKFEKCDPDRKYANQLNVTANEACCHCGGGQGDFDTSCDMLPDSLSDATCSELLATYSCDWDIMRDGCQKTCCLVQNFMTGEQAKRALPSESPTFVTTMVSTQIDTLPPCKPGVENRLPDETCQNTMPYLTCDNPLKYGGCAKECCTPVGAVPP